MQRCVLLGLLASCYQPELTDCTVACSGAGECADGQICGSDGMCAAPDIADHCAPEDGGVASSFSLHITIDGHGQVLVTGRTTCVSGGDSHDPCTYPYAAGAVAELRAQRLGDEKRFERWSGACMGEATTCMVVMAAGASVGARFR